jgi:dTMP kinase
VLDPQQVRDLSMWAADGLLPDVTVLLDLDESSARRRLEAEDKPFDRLEAEQAEFHARVRAAFLELAQAEPARFLVVDARLPIDEVAHRVRARVAERLTGSARGDVGSRG